MYPGADPPSKPKDKLARQIRILDVSLRSECVRVREHFSVLSHRAKEA